MSYLLSIVIAALLIVLAGLTVVLVNRMSSTSRVVGIVVLLMLGIGVNFFFDSKPTGFAETLEQVLSWTYSSLTMFAGQGSIEVVNDFIAPDDRVNWPDTVATAVAYLLHVAAFMFTISAIVNAVAHGFSDRLTLRLRRRPGQLLIVHGDDEQATQLFATLAVDRSLGRRTVVRIGDVDLSVPSTAVLRHPDDDDRTGRERPRPLVRTLKPERRSHHLVNRLTPRATAVHHFRFDDGSPAAARVSTVWLSELDASVPQVTAADETAQRPRVSAHVVVSSEWTRAAVQSVRTPHLNVKTFSRHEIAARQLVAVAAPHTLVGGFDEGRPLHTFSAVVIAEPTSGVERIVQHLVFTSAFLPPAGVEDGRPTITVISPEPMEGDFRVSHPEAHLSAEIRFPDAPLGTSAFWETLTSTAPDLVVVATADRELNLTLGQRIQSQHVDRSVARDSRGEPTCVVAVLGDGPSAGDVQLEPQRSDRLRFFGGDSTVFNARALIDEVQDERAMLVNALYCLRSANDRNPLARAEAAKRDLWKDCSYLDRVSSRASADFNDAIRAVRDSCSEFSEVKTGPVVGQTEHLRWNAFYRMRGFTRMTEMEWREGLQRHRSNPPQELPKLAKAARTDFERLTHLCLVPWEELPDLSAMHERLLPSVEIDFQVLDQDIVVLD